MYAYFIMLSDKLYSLISIYLINFYLFYALSVYVLFHCFEFYNNIICLCILCINTFVKKKIFFDFTFSYKCYYC